MSTNPYDAPNTIGKNTNSKLMQRLAIAAGVFAILFVGVGLFLPARRRVPASTIQRIHCQKKLQEIGLALEHYWDKNSEYPPAYTVDEQGKPLHSWRTLILPYMDQNDLYSKIDLTKSWDDPANAEARKAQMPLFQCPSAKLPQGFTTYLAIVTPNSFLQPNKGRKFSEVTDGPANTIVVFECDDSQAVHWMSPNDANEDMLLMFAGKEVNNHPSTVKNFLFGGNNIRTLTSARSESELRGLVTVDGGEKSLFDN
jgi:Protein of unknown function (DUF1559)